MSSPLNVLFLCTGNSARSILAECILDRIGDGRFTAWSAGSTPKGTVHPRAIELLESLNYPTRHLRSKSWDEFAGPGALDIDVIITVCDNAAGEVCPIWPGRPIQAHWGIPDPAAVEGDAGEIAFAFAEAYDQLWRRITLFKGLAVETLDALTLQRRMDDIGIRADRPARA